jgi:hypothetical protein
VTALDAQVDALESEIQPTPWPPMPWEFTREHYRRAVQSKDSLAALIDAYRDREEAIKRAVDDPLRHGFIIPWWKRAEALTMRSPLLCCYGGNGSGKTRFMAWFGVRKLLEKRGAKVLWLHEAEKSSIDIQQPEIYAYIPPEWRAQKTRGRVVNLDYTVKNGFPGGRFVCPNGSVGVFGYYGQQVKDYEGGGWDLILADENMPLEWLKTLMFRLPRKGGKMVWGYTPINGITPAIREIVGTATTVEHRPAELLPPDHVVTPDCPPGRAPYIQEATLYGAKIIYAFTEDNPFAGYQQAVQQARDQRPEVIERRFYGWARNTRGRMFSTFGPWNIIKPERIPTEGTNYMVADPASHRPWFMLWLRVVPGSTRPAFYVYREWPDQSSFGEWAIPTARSPEEGGKGWDGDPGPAQGMSLGYGTAQYKALILRLEGAPQGKPDPKAPVKMKPGDLIFDRLLDPRAARTEHITEHGGTCIQDQLANDHTGDDGTPLPGMFFRQAPGMKEVEGEETIKDALWFNMDRPLDAVMNAPQLYVSEACGNLIWALANYTGRDGAKGACKDPIDCLRYLLMSGPMYVGAQALRSTGGGGY